MNSDDQPSVPHAVCIGTHHQPLTIWSRLGKTTAASIACAHHLSHQLLTLETQKVCVMAGHPRRLHLYIVTTKLQIMLAELLPHEASKTMMHSP
jgi:hypothetical protein